MAREILFKAKRIDNGEWVEGSLLQTTAVSLKSFIVPSACYTFDKWDWAEWLHVDTDTICQWTGLCDKNGNKIWENDVVYIPYARLEDSYCRVVFKFGQFIGELADTAYDSIQNRKAEVIGNIFDNPELLGGADNG